MGDHQVAALWWFGALVALWLCSVRRDKATLLLSPTAIRETDHHPSGQIRMWRGPRECVETSGRSGEAPACGEVALKDLGSGVFTPSVWVPGCSGSMAGGLAWRWPSWCRVVCASCFTSSFEMRQRLHHLQHRTFVRSFRCTLGLVVVAKAMPVFWVDDGDASRRRLFF